MQTISLSNNYHLKWKIKGFDSYKVTTCGKVINCQRGKEVKRTMNCCSIGYYLNGKFYTLAKIRELLIEIKPTKLPF
jgi:hypothetical protein